MLQELRIKDFAIIDELTLSFDAGFLVITGETGAGKSILVDAVSLLLGERSDATFVRGGADRAVIEGVFSILPQAQDAVKALLETEGLEGDAPDEVVLMREVRANGRSQARVNGLMCSLGSTAKSAECWLIFTGRANIFRCSNRRSISICWTATPGWRMIARRSGR